jgi:2,5-dihydroxypyridine 5,6-dioxygenase
MYEYELTNALLKLLRDMFELQPGETIAITGDTESDDRMLEATAQAAVILGAKPLVIKTAATRGCGKAGDIDFPMEPLVNGIKACDAWIEYNSKYIFYSTVYDRIMEDPNHRPRYMNQNDVNVQQFVRNIGRTDNVKLGKFILAMEKATKAAKHIRVTSEAGMNIEFDNEPGREFLTADGFVRKGEIKMFPGQIAWAPNFESINGTIVVDASISPPLGLIREPISFHIEKGAVAKITGGTEAKQMEAWLKSFNDPQMFKVAHISYGFGPNAELHGYVVEDERIWGCTEWGFGNVGGVLTSDIPGGIPGASHTDGMCLNSSVWLDGVQALDKGIVVGPTEEIVQLARDLGK